MNNIFIKENNQNPVQDIERFEAYDDGYDILVMSPDRLATINEVQDIIRSYNPGLTIVFTEKTTGRSLLAEKRQNGEIAPRLNPPGRPPQAPATKKIKSK